ncbi:MAG: hypothetical protein QOE74_2892 [Mycobacterium sp.]|jgi:hypothetical protein|nr:hypothetical protein [Mycobacterium sp.]
MNTTVTARKRSNRIPARARTIPMLKRRISIIEQGGRI